MLETSILFFMILGSIYTAHERVMLLYWVWDVCCCENHIWLIYRNKWWCVLRRFKSMLAVCVRGCSLTSGGLHVSSLLSSSQYVAVAHYVHCRLHGWLWPLVGPYVLLPALDGCSKLALSCKMCYLMWARLLYYSQLVNIKGLHISFPSAKCHIKANKQMCL